MAAMDSTNNNDGDLFPSAMTIHELVLQRSPTRSPLDQEADESDRYEIDQGENWLRLLDKKGSTILDNTQDQSSDLTPQYPSIVSLQSLGSLDAPSRDCYICVDLDVDILAIKDMRLNCVDSDDDDDEMGSNFLGIARKGEIDWEVLPRRQLRILRPGDRICTCLVKGETEGHTLEYRISEKEQKLSCLGAEDALMSKGLLTQPEADMDSGEKMTETEPNQIKSKSIAPLDLIDDDLPEESDYDSDKTVEMDEMTQTQNSFSQIPITSASGFCTQPQEHESDGETTMGGEAFNQPLSQENEKVTNSPNNTCEKEKDKSKEESRHQASSGADGKDHKSSGKPSEFQGERNAQSSNVLAKRNEYDERISDRESSPRSVSSPKHHAEETKKLVNLSPSFYAQTDDPPLPMIRDSLRAFEPDSVQASQTSDTPSISLLCGADEEPPSQDLLSSTANDNSGVEINTNAIEYHEPSVVRTPSLNLNGSRQSEQDKGLVYAFKDEVDLSKMADDDRQDDDSSTQVSGGPPSPNRENLDTEEAPNEGIAVASKQANLLVGTIKSDSYREQSGQKQSTVYENVDIEAVDEKENEKSTSDLKKPTGTVSSIEKRSAESYDTTPHQVRLTRQSSRKMKSSEKQSTAKRTRRHVESSAPNPVTYKRLRLRASLSESTSFQERRRRGASSNWNIDSQDQAIRVMSTGIELTNAQKHMVKRIGGVFLEKIEDAAQATHVVAGGTGNSLRRTPKLMIGLCKTCNIVDLTWLIHSAKERKSLPCKDYLLVNDEVAESQYNFNMRDTLMRAGKMRSNRQSLLGGYSVFVCAGVAGNKAKDNRTPPLNEFHLILEAAGAKWLSSLPRSNLSKVIVIVSKIDREAKTQLSVKTVAAAIKKGARRTSTEELFHCIMTQHFILHC